jgi:hypothetical protein
MTRKSLIAGGILKAVDNLFQNYEFSENRQKIIAHVHFVLRGNGAMNYAEPTPIDCVFLRGHPAYIVCPFVSFLKI